MCSPVSTPGPASAVFSAAGICSPGFFSFLAFTGLPQKPMPGSPAIATVGTAPPAPTAPATCTSPQTQNKISVTSRARNCGKILLIQNPAVMHFMSRNDVRQRSRRYVIVARSSGAPPRLLRQTLHQGYRPCPHRRKFRRKVGQSARVEISRRDIVVLLESRQRRLVSA